MSVRLQRHMSVNEKINLRQKQIDSQKEMKRLQLKVVQLRKRLSHCNSILKKFYELPGEVFDENGVMLQRWLFYFSEYSRLKKRLGRTGKQLSEIAELVYS
jgi:hypothetical protein